jgi:NhaP-type Na+/H+ or K+/H+ antiporter
MGTDPSPRHSPGFAGIALSTIHAATGIPKELKARATARILPFISDLLNCIAGPRGAAVCPTAGKVRSLHSGNKALFVAFFCVIVSMYGGGFATVPAYLADVFDTQFVGAIRGRPLTA